MSFEKNIQASRIEGLIDEIALLGGLAGSGTLNYVAKFTPDGATLGPSSIFDNGTNVGIGTSSPTASLQVEGSVAYSLKLKNLDATSAARVLLTSHNESNNFAIVTYGSSSAFPDRSSISTGHGKNLDIDLGSSPAGTFRIARADGYTTPSFFIDGSNERIGLGTTSPLSKLYVNASIQNEEIVLNNDDITGSSYFGLAQSGGIKAGMILLNSNHPFIPKTLILRNLWDNGGIRINGGSGDTNIMYFDTTTFNAGLGNVGPTARLHITGVDATSSNYALKVDDSASGNLLQLRNDGYFQIGGFSGNYIYFDPTPASAWYEIRISDGVDTTQFILNPTQINMSNASGQILITSNQIELYGSTRLLLSNAVVNAPAMQVGNAGLASGDLYVDTAANILANGDYVVGRKV